jgi:hypothetical protein
MKVKERTFIVPINLYISDVLFFFGPTEGLLDKLKALGYSNPDGLKEHQFGSGFTGMDDGGRTFVWMPSVPKTAEEFGTLAHEIYHATCFVMDRKGIKYSKKSDEAFAYLIGYLTFSCYKRLRLKF